MFGRGWNRLKLYFMIGLPTEQDDDVVGIIETGERCSGSARTRRQAGRGDGLGLVARAQAAHPVPVVRAGRIEEIERKQAAPARRVSERGLRLKVHVTRRSLIEGVLARGDRRLADVIEAVWRAGARFDGWEEVFDLERWTTALVAHGVDVAAYLGTRPVTARLPWDHIDVGLEDGFLLGEYRKALKGRASPPCGKVAGMLIHHTNLADAEPDQRKLVCYDCGVACDLSTMRAERLPCAARGRGAARGAARWCGARVGWVETEGAAEAAGRRRAAGQEVPGQLRQDRARRLPRPPRHHAGPFAHVPRGGIEVAYTRGFHPADLRHPGASLGVASLGGIFDVAIEDWTRRRRAGRAAARGRPRARDDRGARGSPASSAARQAHPRL